MLRDARGSRRSARPRHRSRRDPSRLMEELHLATRTKAGATPKRFPSSSAKPQNGLPDQLGWATDPPRLADASEGPGGRPGRARSQGGRDDGAASPHPRCRSSDPATVLSRLSGEAARPRHSSAAPASAERLRLPKFRAISSAYPAGEAAASISLPFSFTIRSAWCASLRPNWFSSRHARSARTGRATCAVLKAATGKAWQVSFSDERANHHSSIRRKSPRSAFVLKCSPILLSAPRSRRSRTRPSNPFASTKGA